MYLVHVLIITNSKTPLMISLTCTKIKCITVTYKLVFYQYLYLLSILVLISNCIMDIDVLLIVSRIDV